MFFIFRQLGKTWNIKRDGSKIPRVAAAVPKQGKTSKVLGYGKVNVLKQRFVHVYLYSKPVHFTFLQGGS